jgi:hypothetical protein
MSDSLNEADWEHKPAVETLLRDLNKRTQRSPAEMTCVWVDSKIPKSQRPVLLIDALSLLYFNTFHRDLYLNLPIPAFQTFTKFIPIAPEELEHPLSESDLTLQLTLREGSDVGELEPSITEGFGAALSLIYLPDRCAEDKTTCSDARRLLRAVRLFTHGFATPFENVYADGAQFPHALFKAEDMMYLSSSFEGLLDLDPRHPVADLKYKSRSILGLQYSGAMDLFWAWVDGFFALKDRCVHRGEDPDYEFRANPNFIVSYHYLGVRLFIFLLYHLLEEAHLLVAPEGGRPASVDRCEIVVLFWTEEAILSCIESNLKNWCAPDAYCVNPRVGRELIQLYCTLYHRFFEGKGKATHSALRFIPSPIESVQPIIERLLALRPQEMEGAKGRISLEAATPACFWKHLQARLKESHA